MRKKFSLLILGALVFLGLANPAAYADNQSVREDIGEPSTQYDDSWTHVDWTTIHEGYVLLPAGA